MNTGFNHGSAKIYQFPTERVAVGIKRQDTLPALTASIGSSWYHEEAVQESARAKSVIVPLTFPRQ